MAARLIKKERPSTEDYPREIVSTVKMEFSPSFVEVIPVDKQSSSQNLAGSPWIHDMPEKANFAKEEAHCLDSQQAWREELRECKDVSEQLLLLQKNGIFPDCCIVSGDGEKIRCHKVVLARLSQRLEQQLAAMDAIYLQQYTTSTCNQIIQYAYTNKLDVSSAQEAQALYNFAKDNDCEDLVRICTNLFHSHLDEKNIFHLYNNIKSTDMDDLHLKCLEYIISSLHNLLPNQPFIYKVGGKYKALQREKVRNILTESSLQVNSELDLIEAVEKWAEETIKSKNKILSFASIRAEVEYLLPHLRIFTLEPTTELYSFLKKTKLFDEEEKKKISTAASNKIYSDLPKTVCRIRHERDKPMEESEQELILPTDKQLEPPVPLEPPITAPLPELPPPTTSSPPSDPRISERMISSSSSGKDIPLMPTTMLAGNKRVLEDADYPPAKRLSPQDSSVHYQEHPRMILYERDFAPDMIMRIRRFSLTEDVEKDGFNSGDTFGELQEAGNFIDCAILVRCRDTFRQQVLLAHRAVLCRSKSSMVDFFTKGPVGTFVMKSHKAVHLYSENEVSLKAFEIFVSFQYYNKCKFTNVDEAITAYKGAKQMTCRSLIKACANYVTMSLKPEIVWDALIIAEDRNDKALEAKCLEMIKEQSAKCLTSRKFPTCSARILKKISELRNVNMTEGDLIKAAEIWASEKLRNAGQDQDESIIRSMLKDVIPNIRFLSMTEEDFFASCLSSPLLSAEDRNAIVSNFPGRKGVHTKPLPSFVNPEKRSRWPTVHHGGRSSKTFDFQKKTKVEMGKLIVDKATNCSISFQTDKDIVLHTFTIYSQTPTSTPTKNKEVPRETYDEILLAQVWSIQYSKGSKQSAMKCLDVVNVNIAAQYDKIIHIKLAKPLDLPSKKDTFYCLKVQLRTEGLYPTSPLEKGFSTSYMDVRFKYNLGLDAEWDNSAIFKSMDVARPQIAKSYDKRTA